MIDRLDLDETLYSKHFMRRTKPYLIYKKTKNLRVIQLLLGHKKLGSTVRYLGIEVDDSLAVSMCCKVALKCLRYYFSELYMRQVGI